MSHSRRVSNWKSLRWPVIVVVLAINLLPMAGLADKGDGPRTARDPQTGMQTFMGVDPASPVDLVSPKDATQMQASDLAISALERYGADFGVRDPDRDLKLVRSPEPGKPGSVRYQQLYQGVPVVAGELLVNLDGRGRLRAIIGEISPDLHLSVRPDIPKEQARATALAAVARAERVSLSALKASDPALWIFDERLLKTSLRPPSLTWRLEVSSKELAPFKYLVLINAKRGQVALMFNQIDTALDRTVYDNNNDYTLGLPGGGPIRTEGGAASSIDDVNEAYDYSGDTYNFYLSHHNRDSIDDAGMTLLSTTRYCPSAVSCPYANAFWNGSQMVYGEGFPTADDVVGHELTHGVTERTSNLFYYYQSGAINESFSDVWGEFIDQTNGAGTDTAGVKWLLGEDVPGYGATRDMQDPTVFGDPDKMSSGNYYTGSSDNGGVHWNSGINNKAAYLMTDGDSFNGKTVTGLGITKVAAIYYEAQTNLLTSGADYADLYDALYQSCLNLVGGSEGISSNDCIEVRDATDAVEMNQQPVAGFNPDAAYCPAGQIPVYTYFDDFEDGTGAWTTGATTGTNRWVAPPTYGDYATSGDMSFYADDYPAGVTDTTLTMNSGVVVPSGGYMHFAQAYGFDFDYDGGVLEYSSDGGAWTDAGSLMDTNGYNGTLNGSESNPLGVRSAFVYDSHGYISTRLDLSSLAGHSVRFRFRMGLGEDLYNWGWWIDDVSVYDCVSPTFTDVGPDDWAASYIEELYRDGYVVGCSADPMMYCPYDVLNRAQGSVFILRGNYGAITDPPYTPPATPTFADVDPAYWGYGWIESLWTDGFTAGCGTGPLIYCPLQDNTRSEATVFFLRIKNGASYSPPEASHIFADVTPGWWGEVWDEAAYNQGLLPACDKVPLSFCPNQPLDRSWAAYMMVKAKNLVAP